MSSARLSALDAAFLSLERDHAPMHVGWAALFAPRADGSLARFDEIRAHVESRLHRAPRYRQCLAEVPFGIGDPIWIDETDFDITRHVRRAEHGDFGPLVDEVLSRPLDHDHPLWELWIAEKTEDGYVGVVGKAHHCLVDGLAAVELMALLLDPTPEPERGTHDGWKPRAPPSQIKLVRASVKHDLGQALGLATLPLRLAREPERLLDAAGQTWRAARHLARTVAPLAPPSRLSSAMPAARHLAWHSRPMDDLKKIKRCFDTTVNDILLTASAGALRGLAVDRHEPLRDVKAMVPVSVEAPDERWGNRIVFLFVELPCDEPDPVWRLRDIHVAMRDRKRDGEPEGADAVLNAVSYAPRPLRRLASKVIASPQLSNLTISNIPGPQVPVYLMGCEVKHAYPVVPLTDGHGISIGMTSIHERACFGVYAQVEFAADADRIARGIDDEIEALLQRAGDWSPVGEVRVG